jgi:hypothetical protein
VATSQNGIVEAIPARGVARQQQDIRPDDDAPAGRGRFRTRSPEGDDSQGRSETVPAVLLAVLEARTPETHDPLAAVARSSVALARALNLSPKTFKP